MDEAPDHEPTLIERGMGVHLNRLIISPFVQRRDGEGAFKTCRRVDPNCLEWAQARGLDPRLYLLGCTERRQCQLCARGTT
jgi:hypothetical protein